MRGRREGAGEGKEGGSRVRGRSEGAGEGKEGGSRVRGRREGGERDNSAAREG